MQPDKTTSFELTDRQTLTIYGKDSKYNYPDNVVLFNQDLNKQMWISAPIFKSDKMIHGVKNELHSTAERDVWVIHPHKDTIRNFWGKITGEKAQQGYIIGYRGMKTIINKAYAEIQISDGGMYFEYQYLDLDTCQFMDSGIWGGRF